MTSHVKHEPTNNRYVLIQDNETIGVADYQVSDQEICFTHTQIDPDKRESGMASDLVQNALDDVRDTTDYRVVAECSYVAHWLDEHPDYQGLTTR